MSLCSGPSAWHPSLQSCHYIAGSLQPQFQISSKCAEPFVCTNCGKHYRFKGNLQRHVKHECGKLPQFQCPYCPRQSTQKSNLIRHIKKFHPMEPIV
ncbi:longitudinals lacking protein-like isoform X2 [Schistocerca nitens]|uniref:longitudinals lacking protein-like isoform X2 n=1 Tax=Schistocerca nitens TaxID=7011 RepID=UPI0021184682|nr:longitudinals lacking protein-like isoform X2 [Schistocerca nitens]